MQGEWSCYRGRQFNGMDERCFWAGSLMGEEWSCYGGGQFKGGRMVILQRWPI